MSGNANTDIVVDETVETKPTRTYINLKTPNITSCSIINSCTS